MINHPDDDTTWIHGFNDIYIPVPYDPEIPGVRCVDAEEVENVDVDVAMVTSLSDDGGEDIELQDLGQGDDLGDVGALDPSLSIEETELPAEDIIQTRL